MELPAFDILVCPVCKGALKITDDKKELVCASCHLAYPIKDRVPVMMELQARELPKE